MAKKNAQLTQLKKKYGAKGIDNGLRLNPADFLDMLKWRDELDPHYAKLWLDYTYGGLYNRGVLTERTRLLVAISQAVAMDEMEVVESHIKSALKHEVKPREILETLLQITVYLGTPKVTRAVRVFKKIMTKAGRMKELKAGQLPLDGVTKSRDLEKERPTWRVPDSKFPQREAMMKKYGWHGISTGIRLQPTHHAETVVQFDRLDQNYLKLWLDFIYAGMYVRGILDDKTRLLIMVGVCAVLDEQIQGDNHQRAALMLGATPREVLEVLLHSTIYCGMPRSLRAVRQFDRILNEVGQAKEAYDTQLPLQL
jgi:alkylhydroperoxidase/carboxymuconolactone decarboxylase family protein YurZ